MATIGSLSDAVKSITAAHDQARGKKKWIAGAVKHPGALHKTLGVPEGKKIPAKMLAKAAHSKNPTTAKRARLAQTFRHMNHKGG